MSRFGQCPCAAQIKNPHGGYIGGFDDVASFRAETKAPAAEISDAEIILLIESDKAHIAAHRHKQHAAALYVENAKLRHLVGVKPSESVDLHFNRLEYSPSVWLDRVTSPAASPAHQPGTKPAKPAKPTGKLPAKPAKRSTKPTGTLNFRSKSKVTAL